MAHQNAHRGLIMVILIVALFFGGAYYLSERGKGTIEVNTYPPQATVFIDGKAQGETPLTITGVTMGYREVAVQKEGYQGNIFRVFLDPTTAKRVINTYLSTTDITMGPSFERFVTTPQGAVKGKDSFYIAAVNGQIFKIDQHSKALIWEKQIENAVISAGPVVSDEYLYVSTLNNQLYCLKEQQILWQQEIEEGIRTLVSLNDGLVLAITWGGTQKIFDQHGELINYYQLKTDILANTIVKSAQTYAFLARNGDVYTVEIVTENFSKLGNLNLSNILVGASNENHIGGIDLQGRISVLNLETQEQKTLPRLRDQAVSAALFQDKLLVSLETGYLLCYDINSGSLQWELNLFATVNNYFFEDNYLYLGSEKGGVFIITDNGEVKAYQNLYSRPISLYAQGQTLHIGSRSGSLITLKIPLF